MLSKKTKYALKALVVLAEQPPGGAIQIADLAHRGGIPRKFLEIILLSLKHRNILLSRQGRGGGYSLGRPPDRITLGEVIRALEGPLALLPCASITAYRMCDDCDPAKPCGIQAVLKRVRDATAAILDHTTLADLLRTGMPSGMADDERPVHGP